MAITIYSPSTGGATWTTEYSVTFANESTHDFKTGGSTQSWGGVTWTAVNAANSDVMGVTNSTGLVLDPVQSTDFNGGTKTLPYVWASINDMMTSYALTDSIRILINFTENNAANFDGVVLAYMDTGLTNGYENRKGYNNGDKTVTAQWDANTRTAQTDTADDLMIGLNIRNLDCYSIGGDNSTFTEPNDATSYRTMSTDKLPSESEVFTPATDKILIGAMRGNSATDLSVTVTGFKIQRLT